MARATYNQYWGETGYRPVNQPVDAKLASLFKEHSRPGTEVLDLGCGDGKSGVWLTATARKYVGVDISNVAVDLARERGLDARVVPDAADLPFEDETFDLVVCTEVLEHLEDPMGATREALRTLRPGGKVIATVPNVAYWRNRADLMAFGRFRAGGDDRGTAEPWRSPHLRFFSPTTLKRLFEHAECVVLACGGYNPTSQLAALPVARRLASRRPSRLGERFPGVFGGQCFVVAQKPASV